MMEFRTYDVTLADKSVMSFMDAHDIKEEHGILTVIGKDGGPLAIFYRDTWGGVVCRGAWNRLPESTEGIHMRLRKQPLFVSDYEKYLRGLVRGYEQKVLDLQAEVKQLKLRIKAGREMRRGDLYR